MDAERVNGSERWSRNSTDTVDTVAGLRKSRILTPSIMHGAILVFFVQVTPTVTKPPDVIGLLLVSFLFLGLLLILFIVFSVVMVVLCAVMEGLLWVMIESLLLLDVFRKMLLGMLLGMLLRMLLGMLLGVLWGPLLRDLVPARGGSGGIYPTRVWGVWEWLMILLRSIEQ